MKPPPIIEQAEYSSGQGWVKLQTKTIPLSGYILTAWSDGLDVFEDRPDGRCLLQESPEIRLLGVPCPGEIGQSIQTYLKTIPESVQQSVQPFAWRQLAMLRLLCLVPAAMEIMQSCPLLVWLVADQINGLDFSLKQAAALLSKRREQILQAILGQGSKTLVRMLAKLQPVRFDYQEIRFVYQVLRQAQELKGLRHCRSISVPLLPVVLETPELAGLPLVRELLQDPETSVFCLKRVQMLLSGCRALTGHRELPDFWLRLSRCRSLNDLEAFHRQLTNRYNTRLLRYRVRLEEENQAQAVLNDRIQQQALAFPNLSALDDQLAREERTRQQQRLRAACFGQPIDVAINT